MRILCLLLLFVVLLSACKKELVEDLSSTAEIKSIELTAERVYDQSAAQYSQGIYYTAAYYANGNSIDLGTTVVNGSTMYYNGATYLSHAPNLSFWPNSIVFQGPRHSTQGFPVYEYTTSGSYPGIGSITSGNSINRNTSYTFRLQSNSGGDSTIFKIGPITKVLPNSVTSYTFTSSELAVLDATRTYSSSITSIRREKTVVDGVPIYCTLKDTEKINLYVY